MQKKEEETTEESAAAAAAETPTKQSEFTVETVTESTDTATTLESTVVQQQEEENKANTPSQRQEQQATTTTTFPNFAFSNLRYTPNDALLDDDDDRPPPSEPAALEIDQDLLEAIRSLQDKGDPYLDLGDDYYYRDTNNEDDSLDDEQLDRLILQEHTNDDYDDYDELLDFAVDTTIFDDPEPSITDETLQRINNDGAEEADDLVNELGGLTLNQIDEILDGKSYDDQDDDTGIPGLDPLQPLPDYLLCRPCDPTQQVISQFEQGIPMAPDDDDDDGFVIPEPIPEWLLCRPCDPSQAVSTDEEYLEQSLLNMANGRETHLLDPRPHDEEDEGYEMDDDDDVQHTMEPMLISRRPEGIAAALAFTTSFGSGIYQPVQDGTVTPKNERTCLGHKETVYGLQFSECGRYAVTASMDATIRIWDVTTNALLSTLAGHDTKFECLRVTWASSDWAGSLFRTRDDGQTPPSLVASGAADGTVKLWSSPDASQKDSWSCLGTLDHSSWRPKKAKQGQDDDGEDKEDEPDPDPPQVYALQFVDHWGGLASQQGANRFLMTSSDDYIHLWQIKLVSLDENEANKVQFEEVMSLRFKSTADFNSGVAATRVTDDGLDLAGVVNSSSSPTTINANDTPGSGFGGMRNPKNLVYVFDASYCQENGLLGVALSDGTLRLVNGRGVCVAILALPGGGHSHLTAFSWDSQGTRLASCVATGHLILWNVHTSVTDGHTMATCVAVLEGGHHPGRPLFGAKYVRSGSEAEQEDLVLTWGIDGRLCLWDSFSQGNIHAPISTLLARSDYPLYAVDCTTSITGKTKTCVGVGGGREGGFLGLPFYLYNVDGLERSTKGRKEDEEEMAKANQ